MQRYSSIPVRFLLVVALLAAMVWGMTMSLQMVAEAAPQTPNYSEAGGGRWVIGGDLVYTPESITVSSDTITPTGTLQTLTASEAITISVINAPRAGKVLMLTNISTNTITISETASLILGGQRALGQNDNLTLISVDGTAWTEFDFTNN